MRKLIKRDQVLSERSEVIEYIKCQVIYLVSLQKLGPSILIFLPVMSNPEQKGSNKTFLAGTLNHSGSLGKSLEE